MSDTPAKLNNPDLLRWAREENDLSLVELATALDVSPMLLDDWERTDIAQAVAPTVGQLRALATACRVPFAALYLPEPPPSWSARDWTVGVFQFCRAMGRLGGCPPRALAECSQTDTLACPEDVRVECWHTAITEVVVGVRDDAGWLDGLNEEGGEPA